MNKLISLVLLIGGIALIFFGISASDSIGSSFSRFFTGSPTDKAMWLFIGGTSAIVVGLVGVLRRSRTACVALCLCSLAHGRVGWRHSTKRPMPS